MNGHEVDRAIQGIKPHYRPRRNWAGVVPLRQHWFYFSVLGDDSPAFAMLYLVVRGEAAQRYRDDRRPAALGKATESTWAARLDISRKLADFMSDGGREVLDDVPCAIIKPRAKDFDGALREVLEAVLLDLRGKDPEELRQAQLVPGSTWRQFEASWNPDGGVE